MKMAHEEERERQSKLLKQRKFYDQERDNLKRTHQFSKDW